MTIKFRAITALAAVLGLGTLLHAAPVHADSVHIAGETTTYYTLSTHYGLSVEELMNANPQISALNIYPGLKFTIPGDVQAKTAAVANTTAAAVETADAAAPSFKVQSASNTVQAWGKEFNYDKVLQVKASAYSSAASENGKWGAVDYFGNSLKLGTIAVDPSVIPLGTKVLVTGYTHPGLPKEAFVATATDMGSAIKGNRIDIFIPGSQSFVADFGYQYVHLYIIQ
ncbi:LysM peptidoglycan-binding domain-containing protein [Paenibacillus tritici]|uniref:LysM peptidoglycan-binding domain-containing protein n=1 Tax=Paenibacillus tritici TaxID=1873425 RepID=A0ABX2DW16_9BACL|nr:3D domain-containing protein [Paenibacillus tritici]NQX48885.1 LysM peptidoglycan-binding domain-containing protein [Paenibacillus tritici]